MKGLKSQESSEFNKFWNLIQAEAQKKGFVFFCENGEGRDFTVDGMEGEDISGWLVPGELSEDFEKIWITENHNLWNHDTFSDFFARAEWKIENNTIAIEFV